MSKFKIHFRPSSHSEDLTDLQNYQNILIEIVLPTKVNEKTLPLVLSQSQTEIIKALLELCGKPYITITGKKQTWTFQYAGDEIYFPATVHHKKATIYLKNCHWPLGKWIRITLNK